MNFFRKNQGVITVFVTMIMIPVVAFTGTFVDMARFKFCSSQAIMAADAYAEGVLGTYDNVLKELYGLFSVTQSEEGMAAIADLEKYISYSFNPAAEDGFAAEGAMPYAGVDMQVSYEKVENATLNNPNVLLTQISDFMRFRIIEEVMKETGILDALDGFSKVEADMDVMEGFSNLGKTSSDALQSIDDYYWILNRISNYPKYLSELNNKFYTYSQKMKEISYSQEYSDYVYYLEHKEEIDQAKKEKEKIEQQIQQQLANGQGTVETISPQLEEMASRYVDAEAYAGKIGSELDGYYQAVRSYADLTGNGKEGICFNTTAKEIQDLEKKAKDLETQLKTVEEQIRQLNAKLPECTPKVQEEIRKEIEGLKDVAGDAEMYLNIYDLIQPQNQDIEKNEQNKQKLEEELPKLTEIQSKLIEGELTPGTSNWSGSIDFDWYDFKENGEARGFYEELKALYENENEEGGTSEYADKKKKEAADKQKQAEEEMNTPETSDARNISSTLASQLKIHGSNNAGANGITIQGGMPLGGGVNQAIDRFLLASYNFGMFSSRVTGIEEDSGDGSEDGISDNADAGDTSEEGYVDYSLTKVAMSPDINYLYGAELEYLFGGNIDSDVNLNSTRNIICSIRMTMNFVSTYTIEELNTAITSVANAAAEAVAVVPPGVGTAVAPLVKVAVSAALRGAVAGLESAEDWKQLKNRESVLLFKNNLSDMKCIDSIKELIELDVTEGEKRESLELKLSYEDYLYVLMYLLVDTDTLLSRTSNLITLNVNQSQNGGGGELTSLDFKMEDTITAIESTCKVKMDFVIVPDNFVNMYLSGTDANAVVTSLENRYTGFSIIRGY